MEPGIDSSNYKMILSKYSNLVTSTMRSNKFQEAKVLNRQEMLSKVKALLIKYSSFGSQENLTSELKRDLILCNNSLKEKNAKLQSDIINVQLKNQLLTTHFAQSNEEVSQQIEKEKDFNFIIGNVLQEKEEVCKRINETIREVEKAYVQKVKEEDKEVSPDDALDFFVNKLDSTRNNLYYESRGVNKNLNKKRRLIKIINNLKAEMLNHKNCIPLLERKISRNLISERKGYCNNKTIPDQSNLEDSYANDPSYFDDINLDSDEDNAFEAKNFGDSVRLNKESILKVIPYLNLKQILFNKENPRPEIDENSIERRNRVESIADEIDEIKEKIKLIKKVIKNNKKTELNYLMNINKMNKYLVEKSNRKTLIST